MASYKFHSGLINARIIVTDKNTGGSPSNFAHVVSFVKRDNEIAWFDPNYGEISFSNFNDFRIWFKKEA